MIQQGLFGKDAEQIYQEAIQRPLEEKIEKAIAMIREFELMALQLSPDGYYVAFSGGKDSIVMERLFRMAGVRYQAWYNNVTIDPPELVYFIRDHYPEVQWNNPGKHLIRMMYEDCKGPPTRIARWCCEHYKEQGGKDCFRAIGVRAEESPRRKGMRTTVARDKKSGNPILCPILYWTDDDIWTFIRHNMPYCSLYDEGFSRLGCVGCPMGGPQQQRRDFDRWPRYESLWKRGFREYWERWKGVPRKDGGDRWIEKLDTWEDLWDWWLSGEALNGDQPDCQMWLW